MQTAPSRVLIDFFFIPGFLDLTVFSGFKVGSGNCCAAGTSSGIWNSGFLPRITVNHKVHLPLHPLKKLSPPAGVGKTSSLPASPLLGCPFFLVIHPILALIVATSDLPMVILSDLSFLFRLVKYLIELNQHLNIQFTKSKNAACKKTLVRQKKWVSQFSLNPAVRLDFFFSPFLIQLFLLTITF